MALDGNLRSYSLHLQCARYEANIKGIDADEFPPITAADDRRTIRLTAALLKEIISQVAFSAAMVEDGLVPNLVADPSCGRGATMGDFLPPPSMGSGIDANGSTPAATLSAAVRQMVTETSCSETPRMQGAAGTRPAEASSCPSRSIHQEMQRARCAEATSAAVSPASWWATPSAVRAALSSPANTSVATGRAAVRSESATHLHLELRV